MSLPLKGSPVPGGFSLELLVCDLGRSSTKRKTLADGSSLFIVSLQCPSKISPWIRVLNGVNMKVREIEELKSTNKTPFPGCVYIVGIGHHLSLIYHSKKPSIYIFKRRRETLTSLCRVPCKAHACEEISKQTLHHAGH